MGRPTEKQMQLLATLEAKKADKGLTANQQDTLNDLIAKRDAKPSLQDGAKTYCKQWLKEQPILYNRRKEFSNKYTEKGLQCEDEGIRLTAKINGYGEVFKNTQTFSNEWIIGTPDLILAKLIEDIKCSYDEQTFPLFETVLPEKDYWWQGQGYMDMTGKGGFAVSYCLIDTPTDIIDRQAFFKAKQLGMDEVSFELYEEVAKQMTYPDVPEHLKYKRFPFDRDDLAIQAIHTQVELCREYIENELMPIVTALNK